MVYLLYEMSVTNSYIPTILKKKKKKQKKKATNKHVVAEWFQDSLPVIKKY